MPSLHPETARKKALSKEQCICSVIQVSQQIISLLCCAVLCRTMTSSTASWSRWEVARIDCCNSMEQQMQPHVLLAKKTCLSAQAGSRGLFPVGTCSAWGRPGDLQ